MKWKAMLLQHRRSEVRLIEMVALPAGVFSMGAPETETGHHAAETPRHTVVIEEPFAVGRYAVTVDQFAAFAEVAGHQQGVCQLWRDGAWKEEPGSFLNPGFEQGSDHPAVCVSWYDAQAFIAWLSTMTGEPYRLLTEVEWEYAARAGTSTRYWWGDTTTPQNANYGCPNSAQRLGTVSANAFQPNPWGLYQMHGNSWEWVEDCWQPSYSHTMENSRARDNPDGCAKRVVRGGSWRNGPNGIRSARRHAARPDFRRGDIGFRIAKTLREA